jgi:hypothetical protein
VVLQPFEVLEVVLAHRLFPRLSTMWNTELDPNARIIAPDGLPLTIIVTSCVFLGLSIITVSLRTYVRLVKGTFGWDDAFVGAGTVRNIEHDATYTC